MRLTRSGCMLELLASGSFSFSASRVADDEVEAAFSAAAAGTARDAAAVFFADLPFFGRGAGDGEEGLRAELELSSFSLSLELSLELDSEDEELELEDGAEETLFFLPLGLGVSLPLELLSELESLLLLSLLPFFETFAFFAGRSSALLSSDEEDADESLSLSLESELLESEEEEARLRFCPALAEGAELELELDSESLLSSSLDSFLDTAAPPSASESSSLLLSLSLLSADFAPCPASVPFAQMLNRSCPSSLDCPFNVTPFFFPSFSNATALFS